MKLHKRLAALFAVLCLLLPVQVFAADDADLSRPVSLTISWQDDGTPLVGAEFGLWQVASADSRGDLTPTADFASLGVDLTPDSDAELRLLARTLEGYVRRDNIRAAFSGKTDASGNLQFSDLSHGLYLVAADPHHQDGYVYEAMPFTVQLPYAAGTWHYDLTLSPKYDFAPEIGPDEEPEDPTVTRKVLKVWREDDPADRPASIKVQLLRGGKLYDEVELTAKNNWRHTWHDLDTGARWTVTEDVPDGYTVTVSREGITFVITNTKEDEPSVPADPVDPVDPSSDPSSEPSSDPSSEPSGGEPGGPGDPSDPSDPGDLPQTGQLWWPVPMLFCCGLALILLGLLLRRESHGR
ncbi:MAG: Cna B-type domain-containing protein [Oscillospiraceae bacterium]|nr:Cna B-type domain-containing protein [Oscillospiraceae bacterium]